jgi:hypothetical protein
MLYGEQMDVYIEALRCVDMSQTVEDVQTGTHGRCTALSQLWSLPSAWQRFLHDAACSL